MLTEINLQFPLVFSLNITIFTVPINNYTVSERTDLHENYQLRYYQDGDTDEIIKLLETCYGQWPNYDLSVPQSEHLKWKWLDSPFKGSIIVSTFNEKIVGCVALRYMYIHFNGKRVKSHLSGEAAVHPDHHRNRELLSAVH